MYQLTAAASITLTCAPCHRIGLAASCRLTPKQLAAGVICSSAGNHAQVSTGGGVKGWCAACTVRCVPVGQSGDRGLDSQTWGTSLHRVVPPACCRLLLPQGVALAARALGCSAVICMPTNRRVTLLWLL